MMWYGNGMSGWGYLLMTLNMLLFWGLVAAAIVFLVRYTGGTRHRDTRANAASAERILAERFARGEIDDEEYRRRQDFLRQSEPRQ